MEKTKKMEEIIEVFNHEYSIANSKKKVKGSTFLLTINFNQVENEKVRSVAEELSENLFDKTNFTKLLCYYNRGKRSLLPPQDLIEVKVKSQIEIGKKTNQTHIHALIIVKHTSNVQVNLPLLKKIIYKVGREHLYDGNINKKVYVNIKGLPNASINFEEYIMKDAK